MRPPSTTRSWPVMNLERTRNTTASVMSLGVPEQPSGRLCAEERRFQIGVNRGVPDLFGGGIHARGEKVGGAVDQDIETPELLGSLIEEPFDFGHVAEVGSDSNSPTPEFLDLSDRLRRFRSRLPIVNDDVHTLFRKTKCYCPPEALRGPGDQCHLAVERLSIMLGRRRHGRER